MRVILRIARMVIVTVLLAACTLSSTTPAPSATEDSQNTPIVQVVAFQPEVTAPPETEAVAVATPEITPETTPEPQAETIGPDVYPPDVNPLTGLVVSDTAVLARRPIIVKVSNSPALVRPQSGIGEADLVFEHYTEVGITRFSAIFYASTPTRVGSIRSARLIDYELAPMYQALLSFAGASNGVLKKIYGSEAIINRLCQSREDREQCEKEADIIGPPGFTEPSDFVDRVYEGVLIGPPAYRRDESIPIPHNLFVNLDALWQRAEHDGLNQRPELEGLAFNPAPPENPDGTAALLEVRYRTTIVQWHYDHETGLYYRSTDGKQHFDANTEQQIRAANVVVLYAGHYLTDIIESQTGDLIHWSAQITLWPEGDAVLVRDGLRYDGRWLRPERPDALSFQTKAGQVLTFKPGNTWFQVVQLPEQMDPASEWVKVE